MTTLKWFMLLCTASLAGCSSSDNVDIGDDSPPASLGSKLSDYQGSWSGYAEAFRFKDSTDHVRLVLDEGGQGTLEVGADGPPPAVNTDAGPPSGGAIPELFPAFPYTLISSVVTDKRLKVFAKSWEPDVDYCAATTPVYDATTDLYLCMENVPVRNTGTQCFLEPDGGSPTEIDCGKIACRFACLCTETSCSSAQASNTEGDIEIDAALSTATEIVGTLSLPTGRLTIRLEKD